MLFLTINRSQSIEIRNGSQSRRPAHHETTTSLAVEAAEAAATGNHSLMPPNSWTGWLTRVCIHEDLCEALFSAEKSLSSPGWPQT